MSILTQRSVAAGVGLLVAFETWGQSPIAELDALMQKAKPRAEVLDSADDLTLQVILPSQYSQCLYASFTETRQKNNVAHRYLLEQIDFLVSAGLTPTSIRAIVAYGHAITNVVFASQLGKSIDQLQGNDFKERQKYNYQTFTRLSCVNTFSDQRIQPALKELIKSTRKQTPR